MSTTPEPKSVSRSIHIFATWLLSLLVSISTATAQTCFREWQAAPNGTNGGINCMTSWDPDGAGPLASVVVVGGSFTVVGNISANRIAYWDGIAWRALGQGFNGSVRCLAVRNGELYAGGTFTQSGLTTVENIARWNGSAWQSLNGGGTSSSVAAMFVNGNDLYVGGGFETVSGGSLPCKYIARYNGNWFAYPDRGWGPVSHIAHFAGQLVIACSSRGRTTGDTVIMQWNGSNDWNIINSCELFSGMQIYNSHLYFSGYFFDSSIPVNERNKVKRWNGTVVETVQPFTRVNRWAIDNGQLIAMGSRYSNFNPPGPAVPWNYTFNGVTWSPWAQFPATNPAFLPTCFHEHITGTLYCGGLFDSISSINASNIAQLGGNQWRPLVTGCNSVVRAAASYNGELYFGGDFTSLGGITGTGILKWDGGFWRNVPFSSMNAAVTSLYTFSANPLATPALVIGGHFTSAGGIPANRIAIYDSLGDSWSTLGTGLNGAPMAFTAIPAGQVFRNNLVAGGQFTTAGGVTVNRIARYVSGAWQGFGTGMNNEVRALSYFQGRVIAGGAFSTANGVPCNFIAAWNGTTFEPLGTGTNGTVRAMLIYQSKLVIAGDFTTAGGIPANHIAQWDGTTWQAMGDGFNEDVMTLANVDGFLVAGGFFTASGAQSLGYIGQWNGASWGLLAGTGAGADSFVLTMAVGGTGTLVTGGSFSRMADQFSPFVCISDPPLQLAITDQPDTATVCATAPAQFQVRTNAGLFNSVTYRWTRNNITLVDGPTPHGSIVDGVSTSTLTIENTQPQDDAEYRCVVTGCSQTVSSNPATLTVTPGPAISSQPSFEGACMGQPFTLSVIASGVDTLTYSWQKDGSPLPQTTNSISFPSISAADNGTYNCIVSNGDNCGRTQTTPATLVAQTCCSADFNNDGIVDFFDYLDFVQAFADNLPSADFNNDAIIDFFDYLDFVQAFSEGC